MITKSICPVHHYRYTGARCPICEKERINNPQEAVNDEEVEIEIGPFFPPTIPTDWKWLEKRFKIKVIV